MAELTNRPETTHPLQAWRLTQRHWHATWKRHIPLPVSEAAKRVGVTSPTWAAWELYPDEGGLMPNPENMLKIYEITGHQVRPDHFYRLPRYDAKVERVSSPSRGLERQRA